MSLRKLVTVYGCTRVARLRAGSSFSSDVLHRQPLLMLHADLALVKDGTLLTIYDGATRGS